MPGRPGRRVSRVQYWKRRIRQARDPLDRLAYAYEFFRAMSVEGQRTIPTPTTLAIKAIADDLIREAERLAASIPATELEKGGRRR